MTAPSMTVRAMPYHGPGWTIDTHTDDEESEGSTYQLWAPRPAGGDAIGNTWKARLQWAAAWTRQRGYECDYRRADTAAAALVVFPADPEAQAAARMLLAVCRQG